MAERPQPKASLWLKITLGLVGLGLFSIGWSYATRTPEQKAFDECYAAAQRAERDKNTPVYEAEASYECQPSHRY